MFRGFLRWEGQESGAHHQTQRRPQRWAQGATTLGTGGHLHGFLECERSSCAAAAKRPGGETTCTQAVVREELGIGPEG